MTKNTNDESGLPAATGKLPAAASGIITAVSRQVSIKWNGLHWLHSPHELSFTIPYIDPETGKIAMITEKLPPNRPFVMIDLKGMDHVKPAGFIFRAERIRKPADN